ncbi:MAG TPA: Xaa-Pro peptidase family protein [Aggregatilineales bacterium]|nr:Xaa-Pro peptidase family protein [Aggregatilineales bacterium]
MHKEQRQQTHALLQQRGIHRAVFARPESVKWLTGFAAPIQVGMQLFASSYPLVWYENGQYHLIVVDAYSELAEPYQDADLAVATYRGKRLDGPIESGKRLSELVQKLAAPTQTTRIGLEREFVSEMIGALLRDSGDLLTIDGWLEGLRQIKTAEEMNVLRRNFALTDIGHAAARAAVGVGKREIDVWIAAHSAIEDAAGCRVPLGNDCVVGRRDSGGWPLDIEITATDSVIVDLSVILDGYWSDSCGTYYPGERTPEQAKIHQTVRDALDYGISLVRPGAVAKDIDQKVRQFIADKGYPVYGHHTGHSVGVSGHEAPRIIPYSDEVLHEGMVIMLEPGIYLSGQTGARLEDAMLVTADGVELLTHHDKS